jgi:uncharacterized protein (UPF0303 family)
MSRELMPAELAALIAAAEQDEVRLMLPGFNNDDAWRLGAILVELAHSVNAPVAIDIRRNGQQLFHYALTGSSADNDAWILRKSRVVDRFAASSYLVGLRFAADGTTFEASSRLDVDTYAAHGGSFPIRVSGVGVVGTVTVSGLPQRDDHLMVVAALERFLA